MAVEAFKTTEYNAHQPGSITRVYPIQDGGRVRHKDFDLPAVGVAGADGSTIELTSIPAGRFRICPDLSKIKTSAFGSSRVMKIGHRAYIDSEGNTVAEDDDAFGSAIDVSAAAVTVWGAALKFDIFSRSGVDIFATVTGGTIPSGGTASGRMVYKHD